MLFLDATKLRSVTASERNVGLHRSNQLVGTGVFHCIKLGANSANNIITVTTLLDRYVNGTRAHTLVWAISLKPLCDSSIRHGEMSSPESRVSRSKERWHCLGEGS